jgi:hypothetical protein
MPAAWQATGALITYKSAVLLSKAAQTKAALPANHAMKAFKFQEHLSSRIATSALKMLQHVFIT